MSDRDLRQVKWPLAFALVAIVAIITAAIFLHRNNPVGQAAKVVEAWAGLFKPTINQQTIIYSSLARLTNESKLVVMTATMDVEITKSSEKKYLGDRVDLGTTVVRLRAHDNKAQYIVALKDLSASNFSYDEAAKKVTLRVPAPRVDHAVVEVQSDPSRIEVEVKAGWARLSAFSGAALLDEAKSDLRLAILQNAQSEVYLDRARESATERLRQLLQPLADSLNSGVTLEIEFERRPRK
jgi:hypothetical protein